MLYRIYFGRAPCWRVRRNDPDETPISFLPGWALLSPARALKGSAWSPPALLACDAERTLISSTETVFRIPKSEAGLTPDLLLPIVKWIRFATGQSTLSGEVLGGQLLDDSTLGDLLDLFPQGTNPVAVLPHVELTAISHDALRTQIEQTSSIDVPVYADILLDAIQSDFGGDYMKAVLYSAIAVECVAATRLDEEFRQSQRVTHAEVTLLSSDRDREYAALRNRARRSFVTLLNELPDYVLHRSLKREQPALYQQLLALRDTRNSFVHAGIAPGPVEAYGLAKEALSTALQTFAWFQARGRFVTKHGQRFCAG